MALDMKHVGTEHGYGDRIGLDGFLAVSQMALLQRPVGWAALILLPLFALVACGGQVTSSATVSTLAGTGVSGFADGATLEAQFSRPEGLALAPDGNLYVVETLSGQIRKISPNGVVTTVLVGQGSGLDLKLPHRLSVGPQGDLYVTDTGNNRVVRITAQGDVEVVAGTGERGYLDGAAGEAQFIFPIGIAVDGDGTIYVADSGNLRVRKITPDGQVSTIAGNGERGFRDGAASEAQFTGLNELALDQAGNVYVTEADGERVRKISPKGIVSTVAGNGERGFADGAASRAKFDGPAGIAVDADGNVYVAEIFNNRVRKIEPGGRVLTLAGTGKPGFKDGQAFEARFKGPVGIALGPDGVIFVADSGNHVVRQITP